VWHQEAGLLGDVHRVRAVLDAPGLAVDVADHAADDDGPAAAEHRGPDEWLFRLHVLPHFGPLPLAGIGQRDVRAWVAELIAKELAASTVQRCYQLLSKVMAAAVDAGMIL
jgi:hypothetical protein